MKKAIFGGEVDTIVFWKLDRISRDMHEGINLLADWCERGLRVVSVTEQLDLNGTVGRVVAGVLFGVAEIQLSQIRERQAAGIALAKQRGVYKRKTEGHDQGKAATGAGFARAGADAQGNRDRDECLRAHGALLSQTMPQAAEYHAG